MSAGLDKAQCSGEWTGSQCDSKGGSSAHPAAIDSEKECKSIFWSPVSVTVVESVCNNI